MGMKPVSEATENTGTVVRKPIKCVVTSDKMNKSRVAMSERKVKHPLVGKYRLRRSKFMFHDENNETRVGDEVLIKPSKPLSALKRFTLVGIVKKATQKDVIV